MSVNEDMLLEIFSYYSPYKFIFSSVLAELRFKFVIKELKVGFLQRYIKFTRSSNKVIKYQIDYLSDEIIFNTRNTSINVISPFWCGSLSWICLLSVKGNKVRAGFSELAYLLFGKAKIELCDNTSKQNFFDKIVGSSPYIKPGYTNPLFREYAYNKVESYLSCL